MMAANRYREKRRLRKAASSPGGNVAHVALAGAPELVHLGTVRRLLPAASGEHAVTVVVGGRYEVRVGRGFDAPTLAQVVRTLEQL